MAEDYVLQTKITADSTQFDATLKKTGKSLTAFSSEITNVTKLLGTLFVGQKIVKFAKTSVDSIENERKEINLLNTTLKTTGATAWTTQQQLVDMAKAFESESNYTSEQIQRAQTVMLGFKTVTGDVFNSAMQNVLDMAEVMGMDLVSAVQTVGKALDDPVKGLGSLQRQGFAFSESQKAMLEEMVKTGRQAEAQKIILDELATTYGGAAKAGQNAFQQLNIAVGNLQKVIGENLAPVVESIATDITELINQFNSLDKGTQTFILTAGSLLTTLPLIIKGINTLKVALVSLQTSVPTLLAITAGIAGISAVVGAVVKKKNEFSELSKEITKISSTTKNYLDTYSEGNEEKKLDEKATKELIKLYPELSGKISAYTTSVEDARNAVNDLVNQKLIDAESSGIKDYIQKLNEIEKLNEEVYKLTSHKNELDEKMAKEIQNVSIPAIQKLADEERNSINERLKAIGKLLTLEGSIVEIPIELTPSKNLEATKKSWQEALKEVLKIGGDFSTGKEAVNIYLSNMEEALKQDKRISEALGEKFDISSALKSQQEQISQVIADLLQQTDIDKPFDIEELSKESTALGSLAQAYKQMGEVISSTNQTISEESTEWADKLLAQEIAILEKRRDNEIEWAKNAKKSEEEIYAIRADYVEKINELQVKQLNSQRDAEIKKVKNSKQSAESQKKIISQINEYYDKQIDLMNEATEKFTKKSGGFLEEWSKQYQSLAGNWTQTFVDMANIATSAMGEMFETIGQGLVDNGIGYEDFASIAVEALSEVLKGLAAQLSALAAVNAATYNYGKAAAAAAGAAAALVAAGTLKAVASSMKKSADSAKKMSDELQNSVESLEEFKKRLENIWSGSEVSFGLGKSVKKTSDEIKSLEADMASYQKQIEETVDTYNSKIEYVHSTRMAREYGFVMGSIGFDFSWVEDYAEWEKAVEIYESATANLSETQKKLALAYETLEESLTSVNDAFVEDIQNLSDMKLEYETLYGSINGFTSAMVRNEEIVSTYASIVKNEQLAKTRSLLTEVYEEFANYGLNIGETLMSNIVNGASKSDFLSEMKDYIRNQMLKLTIYTEAFTDQIADIGIKLISAMTQETSVDMIEDIKNELSDLFDEAEKKALKVESVLTDVFGEIKDSTDDAKKSISELKSEMQSLYSGTLTPKTMDILGKTYWTGFYTKDLGTQTTSAIQSQNEAIEEVIHSYYASLKTVGSSMASIFSSGFKEGLSKEDLKKSVKEWIREQLIESTVYEAYKSQLAEIGAEIAGYMANGEAGYLKQVSSQIDSLYDEMTQTLSSIDEVLDKSFGKTIDNIKDSFSDLGGDIADSLISGLSDGLSEADFMQNMYNWIKKLIVQTVVYTESMKSEIESIGRTISEGLSKGFSETSLHELRRDLSYIFYSANQQMSGIDSILSSVFDGYATGTDSALKGLHIVGESGPELVDFKGGERVYNNADTMRMLSGSGEKGNTFNVTFNNLQDTSAYTMMSQLRDYNRQMAINGIL